MILLEIAEHLERLALVLRDFASPCRALCNETARELVDAPEMRRGDVGSRASRVGSLVRIGDEVKEKVLAVTAPNGALPAAVHVGAKTKLTEEELSRRQFLGSFGCHTGDLQNQMVEVLGKERDALIFEDWRRDDQRNLEHLLEGRIPVVPPPFPPGRVALRAARRDPM